MSLIESMIRSIVGFGVVLGILGILALFIKAMARAVYKKEQAAAPAPVKEVVKEEPKAPAKDPNKVELPADTSMGQLDLHDVSDRDAALIMAIVANKLNAPLNTLVFKSIKEVK